MRTLLGAVLAALAVSASAQPAANKAQLQRQLKDLETQYKADRQSLEAQKDTSRKTQQDEIDQLEGQIKGLHAKLKTDQESYNERLHELRNRFWGQRDPLLAVLDPNGAAKRQAHEQGAHAIDDAERQEFRDLESHDRADSDSLRARQKLQRQQVREKYDQQRKALP